MPRSQNSNQIKNQYLNSQILNYHMAAEYGGMPPGQVIVIGSQFLSPYPVELLVSKKLLSVGEGNFTVKDVNGTTLFSIKNKFLSLRDRRVLLDVYGNPLVSLQQKMVTAHRRWRVYRGDSNDSKDLLFSAKKSSMLQLLRTELDVFMASNTQESVCDFKVRGSFLERSCTITLSSSNAVIAQMHKKHSVASILFDKHTFGVTVYPNVDYAFIVALIVILHEINEDRSEDD